MGSSKVLTNTILHKTTFQNDCEETLAAFTLFDQDGSGCINPQELKQALEAIAGETMPDEVWAEIATMAAAFDEDDSISLNFEEFQKFAALMAEIIARE